MKNYYVIKEYDAFVRGKVDGLSSKYVSIPAKTFDELESFIISHRSESNAEALELMTISTKKGIGKTISAKNYVGLIQMNDGTTIEILPKIYIKEQEQSEQKTRKIFLSMLKALKHSSFKAFNTSSLGTMNNNLYEIFISMFISEVRELSKKGLKSNYLLYEENESFYKGKIVFNEHIKRNIVHKERFYVSYDQFSVNRSENKLIKSTLRKLLKLTKNGANKKSIEQLLALVAFELVDESTNYNQDFSNIKIDRSMKGYELLLSWCKIFLMNKSFTTFAGKDVAYALLFPMEKVFEAYMGNIISKSLGGHHKVKLQDKANYLFDTPRKFNLQPDIVIETDHSVIIMDTKWKLLSSSYHNYGISQADMYQMYAYAKKYHSEKVCLLYPTHEGLTEKEIEGFTFYSSDQVEVSIKFVDLQNVHSSVENILNEIIPSKTLLNQ